MPRSPAAQFILEMRWFDRQRETWMDWEIVSPADLCAKYGTTPAEWKKSCKLWIEIGGLYEYRISKRTDVIEWELSYLAQGG